MAAALTRRFGPLPAWAWGTVLAGVVYFYRRFQGAAPATGTVTTTDLGPAANPGFGTPTVAGGGGGDSGLQPDQASPLGTADPGLSGVGTPVIFDPATGQYGTLDGSGNFISSPPPGDIGDLTQFGGPDEVAPPVPFGGTKVPGSGNLGGIVSKLFGGAGGGPTSGRQLVWGGRTFTDQAAFRAWLSAHGERLDVFAQRDPAAYHTFLQLTPGPPAVSTARPGTTRGQRSTQAQTTTPASRRVTVRSAATPPAHTTPAASSGARTPGAHVQPTVSRARVSATTPVNRTIAPVSENSPAAQPHPAQPAPHPSAPAPPPPHPAAKPAPKPVAKSGGGRTRVA